MNARDKQLEALYAELPHVPCKGLCQNYCGPIPMQRAERLRIIKSCGRAPKADPLSLTCNMLGVDGRCTVYALRPFICRLFGAVEAMRCPHGCEPEGGMLTQAQVMSLVARLMAISPLVVPDGFTVPGMEGGAR